MKKMSVTVLCALLCTMILVSCAKSETFEGEGYRLQCDSNLWKCTRAEIRFYTFGKVVFLPVNSTVFPEQKADINDLVMKKMEPQITIYEYPITDGVEAFDEHYERFVIHENDTYPDFTFNGLTPVAQRQCDVRNGFAEDDYETWYVCAFSTDEGSIVIVCRYDSDKTWREMQKILNTLEIL